MFCAANDALGNRCVGHASWRVEHAQFEAGQHRARQRAVDIGFTDQAAFDSFAELIVGASAAQITTGFEGHARRFNFIGSDFMVGVDVSQRPAIRDHMPGEPPIPASVSTNKNWLAHAASPLTRLYAPITASTCPSCTSRLKAGR